jgi:hypothetical protein
MKRVGKVKSSPKLNQKTSGVVHQLNIAIVHQMRRTCYVTNDIGQQSISCRCIVGVAQGRVNEHELAQKLVLVQVDVVLDKQRGGGGLCRPVQLVQLLLGPVDGLLQLGHYGCQIDPVRFPRILSNLAPQGVIADCQRQFRFQYFQFLQKQIGSRLSIDQTHLPRGVGFHVGISLWYERCGGNEQIRENVQEYVYRYVCE